MGKVWELRLCSFEENLKRLLLSHAFLQAASPFWPTFKCQFDLMHQAKNRSIDPAFHPPL